MMFPKNCFHKNEPDMSVSKRIAMEATRIYIRKMLFLSSLPLCGYKKKAGMAGMKGKSGPPGNMNAFKHGLAAIQKRREESTITDHEEGVRLEAVRSLPKAFAACAEGCRKDAVGISFHSTAVPSLPNAQSKN